MRKIVLIGFAITGLAFGVAACNTVEGAGEDIESAANAVDEEI